MENIFVDGMMFKDPSIKAPDWIKGQILIKPNALMKFFEDHVDAISEKGWICIDLKRSKNGTMYLALNTFKPQKNFQKSIEQVAVDLMPETSPGYNGEIINLDDIPF